MEAKNDHATFTLTFKTKDETLERAKSSLLKQVAEVTSQQYVQKLGSIYQELLDYKPLEPGTVSVTVPVQVNYIWKE